MFCSKCGQQIPEGSAFCSRCGTPISPPISTPVSSAAETGAESPIPNSDPAQNSFAYQQASSPAQNSFAFQQPFQQAPYNNSYQAPVVFRNPYTGMLALLLILGFLAAILCNCGLMQLHPDLVQGNAELKQFALYPIWLITAAFITSITDSNAAFSMNAFGELFGTHAKTVLNIYIALFVILTLLALMIFITWFVVLGHTSLKHKTAQSQLKCMNIFLSLSWIFWLIYTGLIAYLDILISKELGAPYLMLQYSICGYILTGVLILMTIVKFIYGAQVKKAYLAFSRTN